ncbi:mitogen-activated protein kinase kinase kinase 2-like [Phalaenopsis equestris]|uniref:mitogen-activated protein kinase kinase kinase 2-like n=1 Tax=Phalaenopsis equestris TaxID=78828 RepID=UPI0009E21DED|nr:mitogen-activated protein kinase kinase kinase 2-like [Phalaenopsis equestris]
MRMSWVRGGIIGKGSFGTVSLAADRSNGSIFAVKSINFNSSTPRAIAALENEIRLLSSLNCPHIVSYLGDDLTEEPGGRFLNLHLEYLPGGTAAELAASGKMTEKEVRGTTRCIVRALHYLHSKAGVVHGDVKGRNVVLESRATGDAKLVDLGSAREVVGGREKGEGTPLWMSPEVARGESATPASDVWSVGCTVIEMVNGGRQPWGIVGSDPIMEMFGLGFREAVPEMPAGISKVGADFIEKCLRREPGERWSCEELLRHSFLGDWEEMSPRSVFGMGEMEDGECVEEEGRRRMRELQSPEELKWGRGGWVEVRGKYQSQYL